MAVLSHISVLQCLPRTLDMMWNTHVIFVITNILMWIFYVLILKANPGYIRKSDRNSYDEVIKMVWAFFQIYNINGAFGHC